MLSENGFEVIGNDVEKIFKVDGPGKYKFRLTCINNKLDKSDQDTVSVKIFECKGNLGLFYFFLKDGIDLSSEPFVSLFCVQTSPRTSDIFDVADLLALKREHGIFMNL